MTGVKDCFGPKFGAASTVLDHGSCHFRKCANSAFGNTILARAVVGRSDLPSDAQVVREFEEFPGSQLLGAIASDDAYVFNFV